MYLALFVGVMCLSLFCYAFLCPSSSGIILTRRNRAGCFVLVVFLMSCGCWCSVALPHDAVCWSAVCDCGIAWSY